MIKQYPGFKVYLMFASTGFAGMDAHEILVLKEGHTQERLDEECDQFARENAEMYGIYPMEDMPEDRDEDSYDGWGGDQYSNGIEGWAEEYNPAKHDGYSRSCQGFEKEIQAQIKRYYENHFSRR